MGPLVEPQMKTVTIVSLSLSVLSDTCAGSVNLIKHVHVTIHYGRYFESESAAEYLWFIMMQRIFFFFNLGIKCDHTNTC